AGELGCDVRFGRRAGPARDDTPHLPVMIHAAAWLRDRQRYDPPWTMILMPTSPFRRPWHIREAVDLAVSKSADSVVSVDAMPDHYHPLRALTIDKDGWARLFVGNEPVRRRPGRRQGLPRAAVFNGAIYLFRTALLFDAKEPSLYGERVAAYRMAAPYSLNIDTADDWAEAERLVSSLS